MFTNICYSVYKKTNHFFRDHIIKWICVYKFAGKRNIVFSSHIEPYYFIFPVKFLGQKNELHHRVLMLHTCINYFDLILNNKELKYLYIFLTRKRFEISRVKEAKKKTILTWHKFNVSCLRYLTWLSVLYKKNPLFFTNVERV